MMMKYKISDICDLNLCSITNKDKIENIMYLDTSSITNNNIELLQPFSIKVAPSRAKRKVKNNTIIYSTVRPNLKHFGILKNPADNMIVSTGFTTIDVKDKYKEEIDAEYIYLLLTNQSVVDYLSTMAESAVSAYPSINPDDIGELRFDFPNIDMQRKIAAAVFSIEEKIALNTRMNAELEAMAKQLYDYWFVQFDFPDENGKPYKSSGGKMVYNEKLKREIPEGWEVKCLNQLVDSYRGVTYNKDDLVAKSKDSVLVLRGNNIPTSGQFAYDSNVAYIPKKMVSYEQKIRKGDIIITMSSGSKDHIGKCYMFQSSSNHTFGAFLSKCAPHDGLNYFVYCSMLSDLFKAFVKTTCNGTGINNLTTETLNNVHFPIPNEKTLSIFESSVGKLYSLVGKEQNEIYFLTHLRDYLLPMLMNGQVTVE